MTIAYYQTKRYTELHSSLLNLWFQVLGRSTSIDTHHVAFVPAINLAIRVANLCSELIFQCQRRRLSNMCRRALICDFSTQQAHILGLRQSHQKNTAYPMFKSRRFQLFHRILANPLVFPSAMQYKEHTRRKRIIENFCDVHDESLHTRL